MSVKVVKVNSRQNNFTHYIGRRFAGLPESKFHNPFHVGKDGDRHEVLVKFMIYWYADAQMELRHDAIHTFPTEAVLGCWCKPLDCHGEIIAGYVNWYRGEFQLCL